MSCILCEKNSVKYQGVPRYESKARQILQGKEFKVVSCRNCGFTYFTPSIDKIDMRISSFYDEQYFEIRATRYWEKKRIEHRIERLKKMEKFATIKIKTFLDVGCGEGNMLNAATERYPQVYGQDIFDNVNTGKLKIPKNNIFIGTLKESSYKDNMFDAIYLDSVLEHVMNPVEFLSEIKQVLSPGGCLYVGVPNEFSLSNFFKGLVFSVLKPGVSSKIDPFRNPYHVIGFSKKSFQFLVKKSGLRIKKLRTIGGVNEFRKFHITNSAFWKTLAFWPIYAIGRLFNNAFYIEAYLTK